MNGHPANNVEINRLISNLIRFGTVAEIDGDKARIQTGELVTDWLHWITPRAGNARTWWAPSIGEQVILFCMNGDLSTAVFLPGIYQDAHAAPKTELNVQHTVYSDGAEIEYNENNSTLTVTGIKNLIINSAKVIVTTDQLIVNASDKISLNTPVVECSNEIKAASMNITSGGSISGNITHTGGNLSSNGVVLHTHKHSGVETGGSSTGGPS